MHFSAASLVGNALRHFPNEQAAMKALYLVTLSLDPKGTGKDDHGNRHLHRLRDSPSASVPGSQAQPKSSPVISRSNIFQLAESSVKVGEILIAAASRNFCYGQISGDEKGACCFDSELVDVVS